MEMMDDGPHFMCFCTKHTLTSVLLVAIPDKLRLMETSQPYVVLPEDLTNTSF